MLGRYVYAVIGSGMQGTAEGYDLARFGSADRVIMADIDAGRAEQSAERINTLVGDAVAVGVALDASDESAASELLEDVDVCCGAAHYAMNLPLTRAAIAAKCHFCDLGGNTGIVETQHSLSRSAAETGVTVVPDCGLAPGLGNILAARAIHAIHTCHSVQIRCGGLPQTPRPPLNYRIVFSVSGLTNEYTGMCTEIRDNRIVDIPAFTECETIEFPEPLGQCEAFLTSGGTSTGPRNFLGKVRDYGYKTIRYRGHFDRVKAMIDLGLLDLHPVQVDGMAVVPRHLFHELAARRLAFPDDRDLVVMRVTAQGLNAAGNPVTMTQDLLDYHNESTGFSAMERTTAYPATVVAILMAEKRLPPGVQCLEQVVDGDEMVNELARRDIQIRTTITEH